MDRRRSNLLSRREAIVSLAAITAGTLIEPASVFGLGSASDKLRFAVIGDWGDGSDDQAALGKQMLSTYRKSSFDFVLASGDNIYPNGASRHFVRKFEEPFGGLLKNHVKFHTVFGNHDVEEGRQDQRQYPLFNMEGRHYYTLHQGNGLVDIFLLDSTDYDSAQAGWFEKDLRASTARWKIVVMHHPLYSSGKKHGPNLKLRRTIEPLLTQYKVNVVFAGHDHIYERVKPQHGVQHFVTGAGGKLRRGDMDKKSTITAAGYDKDNHFMLIELDDKELKFKAITETGELIDSGAIK
ncbi:MAG TPA: metallophosphoesterase [Pyrinomonadaceae bacterium]